MAEIDLAQVTVEAGRFRGATGDMEGLKQSLTRWGLLQPIILDDFDVLVAGFRRLSAAKALGWKTIRFERQANLNDLQKKEIELEENIQREQMTWQERVKALAQLDELKKKLDPNWSTAMTGQVAGTERERVQEAIKLSHMMDIFPELKDAKSLNQARSWALAKVASVVRTKEVRDNPAEFQEIQEKIILGDSVEVVKQLAEGMFSLILTDPPFGIDYDQRKAGTEQAVTAYQDDEKSYERLLGMAPDLYRVLKPNGWLIWFLGPTWYERAKVAFRAAGFIVDEMPVIWDRSDGRCYTARPDRYFARGYDMALHCLKGNPEMIQRGLSNVLRFAPVPGDERDLLVERPVELYQELIRRLTVPGEVVADFFVGSGSVPAAATSLAREYWGCELSPERRAVAIKKIRAYTPDDLE